MQGIDATFDEVSFERGRDARQVLLKIVPGVAALAVAGSIGVWVLHARQAAIPDIVVVLPAEAPGKAPAEVAAKPFGDIIIDPSFLAEMKHASPSETLSPLASLEPASPAPSATIPQAVTVPPPPSASTALPETVPLPPARDVPEIADTAPLPPPRPPEFGSLPGPAAPVLPNVGAARPAAPPDSRNFLQKLLGLGQPSAPTVESRPASAPAIASRPAAPSVASAPLAPAAPSAAGQGRGGFGGLFAAFNRTPGFERLGYDQYTAVYDISARTLYLPDGTRLEAHSGLGDRLDDPRYVSERMLGPTPPNVYELTPREASFHGVQALRLNPIGDGPLFGRAGLLAHPYMLGPNGESNGCVSVKDYAALLRAYENGQVKKLVVVARL
jgi:Tlde1 domain